MIRTTMRQTSHLRMQKRWERATHSRQKRLTTAMMETNMTPSMRHKLHVSRSRSLSLSRSRSLILALLRLQYYKSMPKGCSLQRFSVQKRNPSYLHCENKSADRSATYHVPFEILACNFQRTYYLYLYLKA